EAGNNRRLTPRFARAHHHAGAVWPFVLRLGLCGDWCRLAQCRRERSRLTRCRGLVGSSSTDPGYLTFWAREGKKPHEATMRGIELLGKEVIPALREHRSSLATGKEVTPWPQ